MCGPMSGSSQGSPTVTKPAALVERPGGQARVAPQQAAATGRDVLDHGREDPAADARPAPVLTRRHAAQSPRRRTCGRYGAGVEGRGLAPHRGRRDRFFRRRIDGCVGDQLAVALVTQPDLLDALVRPEHGLAQRPGGLRFDAADSRLHRDEGTRDRSGPRQGLRAAGRLPACHHVGVIVERRYRPRARPRPAAAARSDAHLDTSYAGPRPGPVRPGAVGDRPAPFDPAPFLSRRCSAQHRPAHAVRIDRIERMT